MTSGDPRDGARGPCSEPPGRAYARDKGTSRPCRSTRCGIEPPGHFPHEGRYRPRTNARQSIQLGEPVARTSCLPVEARPSTQAAPAAQPRIGAESPRQTPAPAASRWTTATRSLLRLRKGRLDAFSSQGDAFEKRIGRIPKGLL